MKKAKNFELNDFIVDIFQSIEEGAKKKEFKPIDLIYSMKEMLKDSIVKLKKKIESEKKAKDDQYLEALSLYYIEMLTNSCHVVIRNYSFDVQRELYLLSKKDILNLTDNFTKILKLKFQYPLLEEIFIDNFILTHVTPIINAITNRKLINKNQIKTKAEK